MLFAGHEVTAWLDRGPMHQLFRRKAGGLLYRFYPTMTPELRRQRHDRVRRLTNSLGLRLGATPEQGDLVIGDDGEVVWTCPDVSGGSLAALDVPTTPKAAFALALRMLSGLRAYHDRDLYHGALNAERVLVTSDGNLVLMGFGTAYLSDPARDERLTPSVDGFAALYPTPALVPPELFQLAPLSASSDVFSAAALCYWMLTGQHSHQGRRVMDIYAALRDGRHEPFLADLCDGDADLAAALNGALAPNPLDRPSPARLIEGLTPHARAAGKELSRLVGLARPFGAQFEPLAPEDAPGPPGSLAEKRRQEILKRATLQLAVMERQHREGAEDKARWARRGGGLSPSWWLAGAIVIGLMLALPTLRPPAENSPSIGPGTAPLGPLPPAEDTMDEARQEVTESRGRAKTSRARTVLSPTDAAPGSKQLRRRQLELERRNPKVLDIYRLPKAAR